MVRAPTQAEALRSWGNSKPTGPTVADFLGKWRHVDPSAGEFVSADIGATGPRANRRAGG